MSQKFPPVFSAKHDRNHACRGQKSRRTGLGNRRERRRDGRVDRSVEMPVRALTSCAFGGDDMATLFVTSASIELTPDGWVYATEADFAANPILGGIFAVDAGVRGLPEPAFRG